MMILTDAHGVPFDKPDPPPLGASAQERLAYIRARHAYNDAVTDCANQAFNQAFKGTIR